MTWLGPGVEGGSAFGSSGSPCPACAFIVAGPRVYTAAWLILAMGIAVRLVPWLERTANRSRRWFMFSFPVLLGWCRSRRESCRGKPGSEQWREARRALPSADSPNVLLIVLDTVRADRLSLLRLLPSHHPGTGAAGEAGHSLRRGARDGALDPAFARQHVHRPLAARTRREMDDPAGRQFPTLAEYLGAHGYATAGFVGNTLYCSYDTGLDRGFTHYEDYVLDLHRLRFLRMALLVDRARVEISNFGFWLYHNLAAGPFRSGWNPCFGGSWLWIAKMQDRSIANFWNWLSHRQEPRPSLFRLPELLRCPFSLPPAGRELCTDLA